MKATLMRNQIMITALALMITVAGCASHTKSSLDGFAEENVDISEDDYEISDAPILEDDIFTDTEDGLDVAASTESLGEDVAMDDEESYEPSPGEAVLKSSAVGNVDFASEMKLAREQVREKNKEMLLGIINSAMLTDDQKEAAVDQMIALTDMAERELAVEMLLEARGFTDVVVSIMDDEADVVLNMGDVTDAKRAQIEDIVKHKTNISTENIIITLTDISQRSEKEMQETGAEGMEE